MKCIFFTLSLSVFMLSNCLAQDPAQETQIKKISEIQALCKDIETQSLKYDKVEKDILDESSEGGMVTGYYNKGKLEKIAAEFFGEMSRTRSDYFLNREGSLFFVLTQTSSYDKPFYIEGSEIKNVVQEEYYYDQNELFKWVKSKIEQQANTPEFKNEEKRFYDNFNHYQTILGDYGKTPDGDK